ncbi:hypothetical protein LBMAG26_12110 [Bacteroidota bacterium]|nr:hypothetical protein LBMAG26_12110 [Bacteroidota bacterium]
MKTRLVLYLFVLLLLGNCESPEPIQSALRVSVDQIRFSSNDGSITTQYRINFKSSSTRFIFLKGDQLCYQTTATSVFSNGVDSFITPFNDLNITLPAKLRCVMEVTTLGGEIIRDTSEPLNLGFLDNTPMGNAPNLLAFWPLADDYEDYTANQNHLTAVGALFQTNLPNTPFKGTYFSNNAYLTRLHNNRLNPRALSISAYLFLDDINDPADLYTLVSKRDYTGWGSSFDFKVSKRVADGFKISVSWTINGVNSYYESAANIAFKKATHIVYVHDENTVQIWVNGKKTDEIVSPGLLSNENNLPLCVGARPGVRHSLKGYLRDVGIWGRALNSQEIKDIAALYP